MSKHVSEVNEDNFEQDVLIKRNNSEEGPTKGTSRDVVHTHSMSEMKRTVTAWVCFTVSGELNHSARLGISLESRENSGESGLSWLDYLIESP